MLVLRGLPNFDSLSNPTCPESAISMKDASCNEQDSDDVPVQILFYGKTFSKEASSVNDPMEAAIGLV